MNNPDKKNEYHDDRMKRAAKVYRAIVLACDPKIIGGIERIADDIVKGHAPETKPEDQVYPLASCLAFLEKVLKQNDPQTHAEIVAWEVLTWFNIPRIQQMTSKN